MTGAGIPREIGAGTPRDGPGEPNCGEEADRNHDLDELFSKLLAESPALRNAYERRRREIPGLTIHFEIDPELDEKRRTANQPESGGGTTTGSCGDVHRAIIIDPVAICQKGDRTLTEVLIHELGHILKCRPAMTAEAEHKAANEFAAEVEVELYARGRRDPFRPPAEVSKRRPALDRVRNALSAASLVLGLIAAIVRFIERLAGRGNRPLGLAGLLLLVACDQWHLSINSDGLVFISVIGDHDEPRERFRLRTRDADSAVRILDVPASRQLTLKPASDGPLELTLLTPEGCRVVGSNPRTLTVAAGQEVRLAFDVRCG